ncbi:MAG: hypothetical protein ACLGI6_17065 [Gammaproteobacteria bacterium]
MVNQAAAQETNAVLDKDAPLKEDIRLLGRLLGKYDKYAGAPAPIVR